MLNPRIPMLRQQAWVSLVLFVLSLWLAREAGQKIVSGDMRTLEFAAIGIAACAAVVTILNNWRTGFYVFIVWMMFEDLVRKYIGNGLVLFFGKEILAGLAYVSLVAAIRHGREKTFRPPFLLCLSFFLWLGLLQVFNPNSPSIWYGLLGFKIYFYFVPLMFVGYALIRREEDLRKLLLVNAALAGVIGLVGILQAILGNTFLNPTKLAPELANLGNLSKASPISNQLFNLPDSVFVSSGRYAEYLSLAFIVAIGTAGYFVVHAKRNQKLIFLVIGLLGVAAFLSGNRGCFMSILMMGLVLPLGFLWRSRHAYRLRKAVRRSAVVATLGLSIMFLVFPQEAGSRLAFYSETLLPSSSAYQLSTRAWSYPVEEFLKAFTQPNWVFGNGIGTASLGTQYVAKLTGRPRPNIGVEEGYGALILEMGVIAPLLWILWTGALLYYSWRVVRRLHDTRFFPVALAIFWYAAFLLYPWTYSSIAPYENYVCNAFLWLLVGVLFRLPDILTAPSDVAPSRNPAAADSPQ
jgi:hypothetical protein